MAPSIEELLDQFAGTWKDTTPMPRGILPEGRYQFQLYKLDNSALITTDRDQAVRARIGLAVVAGPEGVEVGRKTTKSWTLFEQGQPSELGFSILKTELEAIGVDVASLDLSQLPELLQSLMGTIVDAEARVKTNDKGMEYQQIFINGAATTKEAGSTEGF